MSGGSSAEILVLSNMQAKALAGSVLAIGGEVFRLKDYDPAYPGQPPWRSGAEGKAYPLLARNGSVAAYLKFFTRPTPQRLDRTAWLIGQQMQTWLPGLVAAPLLWIDTRLSPHAGAIDFDFAGYLAQAVPGETWLELKNRIVEKGVALAEEFRWRCVADLVLATAVLERAGIVHGDLSPNNIVVDPGAAAGEPALYLIDFDAFVAAAAGRNRSIDVAGGGTFGTGGYCPPDLAARAAAGDGCGGAVFRPLRPRHADAGIAADGSWPAAGRSCQRVEARGVRAAASRLAGELLRRCGQRLLCASQRGGGVFAGGGAAADVAAACLRDGIGTAGAARDFGRSAARVRPFGDTGDSRGFGAGRRTTPTKAGATAAAATARAESPGGASGPSHAEPVADLRAGRAAQTPPHVAARARATGHFGDEAADGSVHCAAAVAVVDTELFEHNETWPVVREWGTAASGVGQLGGRRRDVRAAAS